MAYASVRIEKLKVVSQFQSIDRHGRRLDESSGRRADKSLTGNSLSWSTGKDSLDVMGALEARKAELGGAKQYGKAAIGAHLLLTVSPEWIAGAGDIHDPKNPRNQKLFEEAKAWTESRLGAGSVIAMRMDMDEAGGGVVDIVAVPAMTKKVGGRDVQYVSLNKAFEKAFGRGRKNFVQVQDSWAKHCQTYLDSKIQRGVSKEITQKEHVHAEIIAPALKLQGEIKTREKTIRKKEQAVQKRESAAADVLNRPWWNPFVPTEKRDEILGRDQWNRLNEWHEKRYEKVTVRLGDVSRNLLAERERVRKIESENQKLKSEISDLSGRMDRMEEAICEAAYEKSIPLKIVEKLRKIFKKAPALDDVLAVIRPSKNQEKLGVFRPD